MLPEEYTENLFLSVDTIVAERTKSLPYDLTIVAKVLWAETAVVDNTVVNTGKYWVEATDGPAKFFAYGTLWNYDAGDMVYVRITNNDFSALKIITGLLYQEGETRQTFTLNSLSDAVETANKTITLNTKDIAEKANSSTVEKITTDVIPNASVNYAKIASSLGTIDENKVTTLLDKGDTSTPVYFDDGVPVECTTVAAASAVQAEALKLTEAVGSAVEPIYFTKDGKPVKCNIKIEEKGNESTPVYFNSKGEVTACGTIAAAATANKLNFDEDIGSTSIPVYFSGGQPQVCGTIAAAATANKLNVNNTGDVNTPVYFKDGIPVECTFDIPTLITRIAELETRVTTLEGYHTTT